MALRNIARQVAEAQTRGGGNWINPGEGELVVLALKDGTKPEFNAGDTFIAELKVISCNGFAGNVHADGKAKPPGNPVGSVASYCCQFQEFPETAFSNCKTFLLALMGETDESLAKEAAVKSKAIGKPVTADDVFEEAYNSLVDRKANPARGMRIKYSTYEKPNKAKTNIMTLVRWETVPQTPEQIAVMRASLDGSEPKAPAGVAA